MFYFGWMRFVIARIATEPLKFSGNDFVRMSKIESYWQGEFETSKYTSYMIIEKKKNV